MSISLEDADAFLAQAVQFSQAQIGSKFTQHDTPLAQSEVEALSLEAQNLGFLPQAQAGFALWEHTESAGAMAFNLGFLQALAEVNTSLAFAWHKSALANHFFPTSAPPLSLSLLSTGRYGLGRMAFGRYLASTSLSNDDSALLGDLFDRRQSAVLLAPENWSALVWPIWHEGSLWLEKIERTQLSLEIERRQHGLDELCAFSLSAFEKGERQALSPKDASALLSQDLLGLLAIGTGALKRITKPTQDFTSLRRQGGKPICEHSAIMQMLSSIEGALLAGERCLEKHSRPLASISLSEVLHDRLSLTPRLCLAANEAMQAHGGVGYMRDLGIEKVLREQNTLRLLAGGLLDIPQLLAGLQSQERQA